MSEHCYRNNFNIWNAIRKLGFFLHFYVCKLMTHGVTHIQYFIDHMRTTRVLQGQIEKQLGPDRVIRSDPFELMAIVMAPWGDN